MAYNKAFSLFLFTLLLLLLPFHSHATSWNSHNKKSSPVKFLRHLQGCHKGYEVKGIHNLKAYLENFGYLSYNNHSKNHTRSYQWWCKAIFYFLSSEDLKMVLDFEKEEGFLDCIKNFIIFFEINQCQLWRWLMGNRNLEHPFCSQLFLPWFERESVFYFFHDSFIYLFIFKHTTAAYCFITFLCQILMLYHPNITFLLTNNHSLNL